MKTTRRRAAGDAAKIALLCMAALLCSACLATAGRRTVYQADFHVEKAEAHVETAQEAAAEGKADTASLDAAQRDLERAGTLLGSFKKTYPTDFEPTDDSYDEVLADMKRLEQKITALRSLIESLKTVGGGVAKGLAALPLGGYGEGGILGAVVAALIAALVKALKGNKNLKGLFGLVTGEIAQEQQKKPGSMDKVLENIAEKSDKKGMYNILEATLDKTGTKTTRTTKNGSAKP